MQIINNGPDIPERLLEAHEDGHVVFFCGAGISYPAGLPGFNGLVKQLYSAVGEAQNGAEAAAFERAQYDSAIGLLEYRIAGRRQTVRKHLGKILTPNLSSPGAMQTHQALLTLARTRGRDPRHRLVTTNFDRLFELTREPHVPTYCAPFVPVPKNRWNGLVYLHGLLPEENDAAADDKLDLLVLSSGDFGLAYLAEGWAARFVGEVFRRYTVCFVGYSINDPVLRYMMDARAADELRGEKNLPEAFAFGSHNPEKEKEAADDWRAKYVTPILYADDDKHTRLHQTLHEWAKTYHDGLLGKQRIIGKHAEARPQTSTKEDDFVGRILWALSDASGEPAKRFAELETPLEWLDVLTERRFGRQHLSGFDISPESEPNNEFAFGILDRPGRASRTPPMSIVQRGFSLWDEIMFHLGHWLVKYLDEPKLFLWIANQGSPLHPQFAHLIVHRLDEQPARPPMQKLWRLMLAGKVRTERHGDFYGWRRRIERDGLTLTLRLELRELLTPRLEFSESSNLPGFARPSGGAPAIRDLVDWKIVLGADCAHLMLKDLQKSLPAGESLAPLLPDLTSLLRDALDLMRELEGAANDEDDTDVEHPSISEHPQNRHYHDWTMLIDLARDAWLATADICPYQALLEIKRWLTIPYPLFKRLAFFAATDERVVAPRQALEWLLMNDYQWFWSSQTMREAIRLTVALAPKLASDDANILQGAILQGPPREQSPDHPHAEDLQRFADYAVWRRLAKIQAAGASLNDAARNRLQELSHKYPYLELPDDERDEFRIWMGDDSDWRTVLATPKRRRDLVDWLRKNSKKDDTRQEDDWRERCERDFPITSTALCQLARNGEWNTKHWRQALQAWSGERLAGRSYRHMGRLLSEAPDDQLKELAYPLGHWLKGVARTVGDDRGGFLTIAGHVLALHREDVLDCNDDPVNAAINHPVGNATQAILAWWFRQELEDNQGINSEIRPFLEDICDISRATFRHGRLILAQNAVTLFRVDPHWTGGHVLPLFDWGQSEEDARAAWCGFLWTARPYGPFLAAVRPHFIATSHHHEKIGRFAKNHAALLAFVALEQGDSFSKQELVKATCSLKEDGLSAALQFVIRSLPGADEPHDEYWRNRVLPYLHCIWPKSANVFSPSISAQFVELCIAAGDQFGEAVDTVHAWLQPISASSSSFVLISKLSESGLCEKFPCKALDLLRVVVNSPRQQWGATRLPECLDRIEKACPELTQNIWMTYLRNG